MNPVGYYFGIPLQVEVIVCIVFGICFSIFDASLLDLNTNLQKVWTIVLDYNKFSDKAQLVIKYLLSGILLVRSFSVHIYLAFYIVMLWPVIFEDKPGLLLPWLTVGAIKSIGISFLSTFTGLFICAMYGLFRPVCFDFLLAQILNHGPSVYVWYVVHSFYEELKEVETLCVKETQDIRKIREAYESELAVRRRKARSMTERQTFHMLDDGRNLISASTIENMLQQLAAQLDRKTSRSLDTMLGLMAAEAEQDDILNLYDDFYTAEEGLSVAERTRKLLKLTALEIEQAKRRRGEKLKGLLLDDGPLKNMTTTNFGTMAQSSSSSVSGDFVHQTRTATASPSSEKLAITATDISRHNSEKEICVIRRESSLVNGKVGELTSDVRKVVVAATSSKPKSILKPAVPQPSVKRRERTAVKDASCQVIGLGSTNVAKVEHTDRPIFVPSTKKVSPRTHLTNPAKVVTFSKEPVPINTEGQTGKGLSGTMPSFKEDGYMSAYRNQRGYNR